MDLDLAHHGAEFPATGAGHGREKLQRDRPARVGMLRGLRAAQQARIVAIAGDVAQHAVERHQRKPERKRAERDAQQLQHEVAIGLVLLAHEDARTTAMMMKPK